MTFASLPPADRWAVLDRELPRLIANHVTAAAVDPSDEICVAEIAAKHGIGERAMVTRLQDLGGKPYQIGKGWFIRRKSYVTVLESAERSRG
ncbi:hypothetical protein OJ996_25895 [Luteolibacter sp. GHJ8]|uniref:Helix-turn-helix protein n=1 Tax=Luteolibacter rhizosphaerae TaxID=2989719 RepID=A0ABT3GBP4_9BACT|nr:hypothetical protein [Luteolibacter rhizosphaerae]MCW1917049.1 hypothetical protein [Luteolibacter rhizosphaerae]